MKNVTDFEDLLKDKYGEKGTPSRDKYDADSLAFRLGVMLKEARREACITQEELAERTGTKKSYISRIENAKGNIQLSTLIRIFEKGLNRKIGLTFL
jgi:ribosome-binding protein aMBF1 (putative translation factor)